MSVYSRANGRSIDVEFSNPTMASGFSLVDYAAWASGPMLTFYVTFLRTGATIAGPNITNTLVCTLPTAQRGVPTIAQPICSGGTGPVATGYYTASSGVVYVAATASAAGVVNGSTHSLGGVVLL